MTPEIHLWLDDVSDPNASWIVSVDDDSGSGTLGVFPPNQENDAKLYALSMAKSKNLPAFKVDKFGNKTAILYE